MITQLSEGTLERYFMLYTETKDHTQDKSNIEENVT